LFRINLFKGFVYPLTKPLRLLAACLVLPLSLVVLVPPILLGLGVLGTVDMNLKQGLGFTLAVGAVCVLVGAIPFTFLAGYTLRCRKRVIAGESTLPPWSNPRELLSDGGKMDTLALIVGLPTMGLFWGGVTLVAALLTYLNHERTWEAAGLALLGSSAA